jgi:hypothetical protein
VNPKIRHILQRSLAPLACAAPVGLFGWRTACVERALAAVSLPVC